MSLEHAPSRRIFSGIPPGATAVYLTAAHVRARYGGVSDMTIWRWLKDPGLAFPKPRRINRRRYWKISDLDEFDRHREADLVGEDEAVPKS